MLAKFFASFLGIVITRLQLEKSLYLEAFLLGILPIWSEVLASNITKTEPSLEKDRNKLYLDGVLDALVFIIIPSVWYYLSLAESTDEKIALIFFIFCGLTRLFQFVRKGLNHDGYFRGLPVTYTGYMWLVLALLKNYEANKAASITLVLVSILMITNKIKIKVRAVK